MNFVTEGTKFGCSDGGPPETCPRKMSRIMDALNLLEEHCGKDVKKATWDAIPRPVKMDMVYAKWAYVSDR